MFQLRPSDPDRPPSPVEEEPSLAIALIRLNEAEQRIEEVQQEFAELTRQMAAQTAQLDAFSWGLDQMSERLKLLCEDDFVAEVETEMDHRIPVHLKNELADKKVAKFFGR
jgi:predicted RNase H-like nuclease (RuvC/YqgF family)